MTNSNFIRSTSACLIAGIFIITGCSKKEDNTAVPQPEPPAKVTPVAVVDNTAQAATPKPQEVKLDEEVLSSMANNLDKAKVNVSDWDSFEESMADMQAEMLKLPTEERRALQSRLQEISIRLMTDLYKSQPEILDKMATLQNASMEDLENFQKEIQLAMFKDFDGKTIYEIIDTVEQRSAGRPPALQEMQQTMKEMQEQKIREMQNSM